MTAVARIALLPRAVAPRPRELAARPLERFSDELHGARRPAPLASTRDAGPAGDAARAARGTAGDPTIDGTNDRTGDSGDRAGAETGDHAGDPAITLLATPLAAPLGTTTIVSESTEAPARRPGTLSIQIPPLADLDADDDGEDDVDVSSLTPLEQAIADLVDRSSESPGLERAHPTSEAPRGVLPTSRVAQAIAPREIAERAEAATSASHVHLVIDEGDRRVVITVAVRGNDVNVALRSGDDATLAALARNAGSLDEAMRLRGLELTELTTGHDRDGRERDEQPHQHERREAPRDTFTLEEHA